VAHHTESKAQQMAEKLVGKGNASATADELKEQTRKAKNHILDSMNTETVYNLGLVKYTYQECKEQELGMGLDLQGGMSVVLQVSEEDVVNALAQNSTDANYKKAFELAKQKMTSSNEDFVALFSQSYNEVAPNGKLASIFNGAQLKDKINFNSSNSDVISAVTKEVKDAVKRTYNIISARIDKFGVTQANISLEERSGRILVELPGVDNPERVRKLLQATAKLEFWEMFDNAEIAKNILDANKVLSAKLKAQKGDNSADTTASLLNSAASDSSKKETTLTPVSGNKMAANVKADVKKSTVSAIKKDTSKSALIEKERADNALFTVWQPMLDQKGTFVQNTIIGYVSGKDTNKLNSYLSYPEVKAAFPKNALILYSAKPIDPEKRFGIKNATAAQKNLYEIYAIKKRMSDDNAPLDGSYVTNASRDVTQQGGNEIVMQMSSEGATIWQHLTAKNVKKPIAIVLDNKVYSAPTVQAEISGGRSSITGDFSAKEAIDMSNILQTGKLPAPARIIQEDIVGATLGDASINAGFWSFMVAFLVIVALMYLYYSIGGLISNVALVLNLFFTIGVLTGFGFSLSMSAIAGLVVTIGMAVDTNVIIFERIKEEILRGKSKQKIVEDGYKSSYAPIIDAHITTLLTGGILFYFGLGPVKGFATTLIVGLIINLFCGILITRWITDWMLSRNKNIEYITSLSRNMFKHFNFDFVGKRKYAFMISGALSLIGIASIFTRGFDKGVDFLGGRTYTIQFEKPLTTNEVREKLTVVFDKSAPIVKTVGSNNQMRITTSFKINESDPKTDSIVEQKLYIGLKDYFGDGDIKAFQKHVLSSQKVGPTIADDIKMSSIWATLVSLLVIFIYIVIRFRKWQYGLGTIISLFHDVTMVLGLFSIFHGILPFSLEIDQTFIAAILTIIGYSMNDTVIVFDRIREYVREQKGRDLKDVINDAINHTMSRTIMTSLTVFLVVLILFIFGGEVTRGFAFAMLIGVITGTYSSIFVAMPVLYDLRDKKEDEIAAAIKK
jgi:SecD/SecF fusion protein